MYISGGIHGYIYIYFFCAQDLEFVTLVDEADQFHFTCSIVELLLLFLIMFLISTYNVVTFSNDASVNSLDVTLCLIGNGPLHGSLSN